MTNKFSIPIPLFFLIFFSLLAFNLKSENKAEFDIRPYGELCFWSEKTGVLGSTLEYNNPLTVPKTAESEWNVGVRWNEERDVEEIEVEYVGKISEDLLKGTKIQYWFQTWPGPAPKSHTIEDPMDDPWQGMWITAETNSRAEGNKIIYSFSPLKKEENRFAGNLPGVVNYRRSLKLRLLYSSQPLDIRSIAIFSPSQSREMSIHINFGIDKKSDQINEGKLEIFNGRINSISGLKWGNRDKLQGDNGWKIQLMNKSKGIKANITAAVPKPGGSNDLTVVTVRSSNGTFSFAVDDLKRGPVYIPAYSVFITTASDTAQFRQNQIQKGFTIREKIKMEPEQTYERATREIPKLNVMLREEGGKLYLPLAADASWQKFAFEWGGNIYLNKRSTKAKGKELERCNWEGSELRWMIGTGEDPVYIRDDKNSHMSILNEYLPVAQVRWNHEGLNYYEEAFTTLLEGPLSPYDEKRDEQTPAVLMVKIKISNPSNENKRAYIWLKADKMENPVLQDMVITDQVKGNSYIRAKIDLPSKNLMEEMKMVDNALRIPFEIPANQFKEFSFSVPFVGDLQQKDKEKFISLDYTGQYFKVVNYWRDIVKEYTRFDVPEPKFCDMARSVIPHIRMSTTKDPKTGLFMVPAASFGYQVYANESAFQTIFLDKIGDHKTAESYLETFLKLQGTTPMPGTFTGDQSAVFHGGKIDNEYNYTSGPYNLDHGTVLWALGLHFLSTRDSGWLQHASDKMLKAADWIITQRNQTKSENFKGERVLHYGLLPAGRLEDNADWGFWFAVNAYAYLGLKTTAEAFKTAGLAEGERLEKEAASYLSDLRTSIKRSSELSPVVRLRNNTYIPYVPSRVYQRFRYFGPMQSDYYSRYGQNTSVTYRLSATREALYGPLILITTGILDPDDPLSEAILDDWEDNITISSSLGQHIHGVVDDEFWFSRGGMVFQPNLQNPIQAYLMRNEIPAALRSIYNSMVSCFYPDVNAFTEEYRRWGIGSGPMYKIPDEARFVNRVCDMLVFQSGNELRIASGIPRYWLEPGKNILVNELTTIFGNVSYEMKSGTKPNSIEAKLDLPQFKGNVKLYYRTPFSKRVKSVSVNGKNWSNYNLKEEYISLPGDIKNAEVLISFHE